MKTGKRNLRSYVFATYLVISVIPLLALGIAFYSVSYQAMMDNGIKNAKSILHANIINADNAIFSIHNGMSALGTDTQLMMLLLQMSNTVGHPESAYFTQARKITNILGRYFTAQPSIYSSCIVTPAFTYADHSQIMPTYNALMENGIWEKATKGDGRPVWISTYNYLESIGQHRLHDVRVDYRYLTSVVSSMHFRSNYEGYASLNMGNFPPILMINFKPESIGSFFDGVDGGSYVVFDHMGGKVVETEDSFIEYADISMLRNGNMPSRVMSGYLISSEKMKSTGWLVVQSISMRTLLGGVASMPNIALLFVVGAICAALIIAGRFNRMNERIELIQNQSYNLEIQSREAEIKALNTQLNPHFLYNTLGSFYYMALQNGDKTLSKLIMAMCNMLRYTSRSCSGMVPLREDIAWLNEYLFIMESRQSDHFRTTIDISEELMSLMVPRLFLQPFIENSILHAFTGTRTDYSIAVTGQIVATGALFTIADNGEGMSQEKADAILTGACDGEGIRNVQRRLVLSYGTRASITINSRMESGVVVAISIPYDQ
jgi:two-component system sensor histidine kinase YesM